MSVGQRVLDMHEYSRAVGPITVISKVTRSAQHTVTTVFATATESSDDQEGTVAVFGAEGVNWIRGHHASDIETVQALFAAHALVHG